MSSLESQSIEAAVRGDALAFKRLVDAHARPMFGVCLRILGDRALAEDALQDAFLSAWRALDRFDRRSALGTWLHRIAVNAALAQLRRQRPDVALQPVDDDDAQPLPDPYADPLEHAAGEQLGRQLQEQLDTLSAAERSAFVLRHFEHYPMQDIAALLGCNVNACKQAVFRAVRKLRLALAPIRSEP